MKTELMPVTAASIALGASLMAEGKLVAFPTETVYGLGADALNGRAVLKIFEAKGRPADNPLIAHISDKSELAPLVARVDERAQKLMNAFWPGPLTMVFPKSELIPDAVSAGLSTVAVRMPSHPAARMLIRALGRPIAAPSANRSGKPSPTTAAHVFEDMEGRIPLILDGGPCGVGVESTVLDLAGDVPTLLRPGGITAEMLREYLPDLAIHPAVLHPLQSSAEARSPGMKYKHYAPNASIVIVRGTPEQIAARYDASVAAGKKTAILCADRAPYGDRFAYELGHDASEMASRLFAALRAMDDDGIEAAFSEQTPTDGVGLALTNRLLRAAGFQVEEG